MPITNSRTLNATQVAALHARNFVTAVENNFDVETIKQRAAEMMAAITSAFEDEKPGGQVELSAAGVAVFEDQVEKDTKRGPGRPKKDA